MDVAEPREPGLALSHDISTRSDEAADAEIERFISKRSVALASDPEARAYREEAAWRVLTKKANAAREAELREQWSSYHLDQAERHRAVLVSLIEHHESKAEQLMKPEPKGAA